MGCALWALGVIGIVLVATVVMLAVMRFDEDELS